MAKTYEVIQIEGKDFLQITDDAPSVETVPKDELLRQAARLLQRRLRITQNIAELNEVIKLFQVRDV
jgi:hypothetical protein